MRPSVTTLHNIARAGFELLFPASCTICAELAGAGEFEFLCAGCADKMEFARAPYCSACGWPFPGAVEGERRCPHCIDLDPQFGSGRTGMLMRGAGRVFIHELKYHRGIHLAGDVQGLIRRSEALLEFARGAILVPVPLHPKRLRWRGFNQAVVFAEALVGAGGAVEVTDVLERVRDTPSQTRLDRAARERNMKNAFAVKPGAQLQPGIRYVLVDDVFTTGATLNACATVLRVAGATQVDVATLGHG